MKKMINSRGSRFFIAGLAIAWVASIGLAVQLKTLLTPGNYPIGRDPSLDITAAVFFGLLAILGGVLAWGGWMEKNRSIGPNLGRILNGVTIVTGIFLGLVAVITVLLFSANLAFMRQYIPSFIDEPKPDYSYPNFPAPVDLQPTPVYDPNSINLSGPILSSLDGLRVGQVLISLAADMTQIETILIQVNRISCNVQQDGKVTTYAVDQNKILVRGPVLLQDDSFYTSQMGTAVHGIITQNGQAHGTIYLQYINSAGRRTCDLGNFEWSAALINR